MYLLSGDKPFISKEAVIKEKSYIPLGMESLGSLI